MQIRVPHGCYFHVSAPHIASRNVQRFYTLGAGRNMGGMGGYCIGSLSRLLHIPGMDNAILAQLLGPIKSLIGKSNK